jgi:TnpA family transposase
MMGLLASFQCKSVELVMVARTVTEGLFEFNKLIRSIYTLQYLLDSSIYKNAHKSQNRVEQYHQLRGAVAQAYGKKEIIGKTDIALTPYFL